MPAQYQRGAINAVLATRSPYSVLPAIVNGPKVQDTLTRYEAADEFALEAQNRYRSWARRGLQATTFGVLMGAILLFPLDDVTKGEPRLLVGLLQTLALVATFGAMLVVTWLRPLEQWMSHRAEAERLRGEIFAETLSAPAPEGAAKSELAQDKLELILAAYIREQLNFFERRSRELRRAASKVSPLRVAAYVLIAFGALLGFVAFINLTGLPVPAFFKKFTDLLSLTDPNRWQLGFTTIASAFLAYASARNLMDEDERKAELYQMTAKKLNCLLDRDLPAVQSAARAGDEGAVGSLFSSARNILQQEHAVWSFIRERDDEEATQS